MSKIQPIVAPVRKTIEVNADAAKAFDVFVAGIATWWPMERFSQAKSAAGEKTVNVAFEPMVNGRLYETQASGEQREWGRVLAYEPGKRIVFSWIVDRPAERATEVEVIFEPLNAGRTRVSLEHRLWERMGEDGAAAREQYNGGWGFIMEQAYAARFA